MTGFELLRSDESMWRNSYQMLNISQLKRISDSLKRELHNKSMQSYQSLLRNYYFRMNATGLNRAVSGPSKLYYNSPPMPVTEEVRQTVAPRTIPTNAAMVKGKPAAASAMAGRERRRTTVSNPLARHAAPDTVRKDSVFLARKIIRIHDFDSLYNSYDLREKLNILKSSMNYVSLSQSVVGNATSNFAFETKFLRRHEVELHRKFTLAFACLIFLFIGAPLGAIIRKGGLGMPTVIATLLFILYYIISMTGEKFVRESVLSSFPGMWISSVMLVIAGVFLTYQATNDSAMLNIDTYMNWLREKTGLRKGLILEKKTHITGRFELTEIPRARLQDEFMTISEMAAGCIASLKTDARLLVLARKSITNTGFFYLVEFAVHYNSFIDQVILSKWFRIPYFQKRLEEFPFMAGRITNPVLRNKLFLWAHIFIFPLALLRIVRVSLRVMHIRRNLKRIIDLSAGMINLLNSSALKPNQDFAA